MNTDPNTGIRFTVYSCSKLDGDVLHSLIVNGKDLTYAAALDKEIKRQHAEWAQGCENICEAAQDMGQPSPTFDDFKPYLDNFDPQIEEPVIEGEVDGVKYRLDWLGGAQMLLCLESPIIGHFALCSPCVPGACDGNNPTSRVDGYMGYAVPPDWLHIDPDPRSFNECMEEYE